MNSSLLLPLWLLAAGLAAGLAWLGMAGAAQFTARRQHGYLHLMFPALLCLLGLNIFLSGRDLTTSYLLPPELVGLGEPATKHPVVALLQPLVSVLLLGLAGERLLTHWLLRKREPLPRLLPLAFAIFWLGTTASPALLGAHPWVSHDYVYPLAIGLAASLASARELDLALRATRTGLLLLMAAGLALVPLQPELVMDRNYGQGLIPGLPRFAGLATHPVSMGLLAQLGLLCLVARPFEKHWLQRAALGLTLGVLVMAQSKTAWVTSVLATGALLLWRDGPSLRQRLADPLRPQAGMLALLMLLGAVAVLLLLAMFGNVGERLDRFFNTPEGAQLASLTGRDRIWAIAWDEWARSPVFGYGPTLWGEAYRQAIGMSNATHAHNQFMDTLSRAGLVGAVALVGYALLLLVMALRAARATAGLSVALYLSLALRSLSEVPLLLFGYGPELITHVLLLMVLASATPRPLSAPRAQRAPPARARAGRQPSFHP